MPSKSKYCCGTDGALKVSRVAGLLKVISEENRLKILCLLKEGEMCVCEIWPSLGVAQNLVSHHLKILRDSGLIKDRKVGLKVFYSIDRKEMKKFNSLLIKFLVSYERKQ